MGRRVLVVDDHPMSLKLVTELLQQERYEVLTANSAQAGLRLAEAHRPGLILMDLGFPGMTGYTPSQGQFRHAGDPGGGFHRIRDAGRRGTGPGL